MRKLRPPFGVDVAAVVEAVEVGRVEVGRVVYLSDACA